jgi:phage terminase large subunit-like protein
MLRATNIAAQDCQLIFENNQVFFPHKVTAPLIKQVLGFGVEKHDDLVDALTIVLNYIHLKVTYGMLATFYPYDDEHTIYTIRHAD